METSYLRQAGETLLSMRPLTSAWQEALTAAYLSVVGHDDQLHVLGGRLDVALVLQLGGRGAGREGRREGENGGVG